MRSVVVLTLLLVGAVIAAERKDVSHDFEAAKVGSVPKGWTVAKTGTGEGGVWSVVEDKTAPKGTKVLAQTAESPTAMFNLCVSVAFKAVKGEG